MADQKLTELTELTSASGDDITYIVDDPGGSPLSRKITIANLIAGGWIVADAMTYASADDPTYTMTCSGDKTTVYYAGQRIKLTQSTGGTKYFIVTKVAYSDPNTTLTLYGGTDYNLENEAISTPYYSLVKAPAGFPLDPTKWTVEVTDTTQRTQASPVQNTWYNLGSITITLPIGIWNIYYKVDATPYSANTIASVDQETTLSTANNSESDEDFTTRIRHNITAVATNILESTVVAKKTLVLTSKTAYYLNARTTIESMSNITFDNAIVKLIIRAVCAYL